MIQSRQGPGVAPPLGLLRKNTMSFASNPKSPPPKEPNSALGTDTVVRKTGSSRRDGAGFFALRRPIPQWQGVLFGLLCLVVIFGLWWLLTRGEAQDRILGYRTLPSPGETFAPEQLHELWFDNALTRNLLASLHRVLLGFALAA